MLRHLIPVILLSVALIVLSILLRLAHDNITLEPALVGSIPPEPVLTLTDAITHNTGEFPEAGKTSSNTTMDNSALSGEQESLHRSAEQNTQPENTVAEHLLSVNDVPNASTATPVTLTFNDLTPHEPEIIPAAKVTFSTSQTEHATPPENHIEQTPLTSAQSSNTVLASAAPDMNNQAITITPAESEKVNLPDAKVPDNAINKPAVLDELSGERLAKLTLTTTEEAIQPLQKLTLEKFLAAKWSANGGSTSLLPSTRTSCQPRSGRVECWSQAHQVSLDDKDHKAKTRSLIQNFSSSGFTIKYKHMLLSAELQGRKWDNTTYLLHCTVETASRISCIDRKSNKQTIFSNGS